MANSTDWLLCSLEWTTSAVMTHDSSLLYMGFFGSYARLRGSCLPRSSLRTCVRMERRLPTLTCSALVYHYVQLHAHDGVDAAGWSDAWVLRWYCRSRLGLPGYPFAGRLRKKSLAGIDELFSFPTAVIVKRNLKQTAQVIWDLSRFRLKKVVFSWAI